MVKRLEEEEFLKYFESPMKQMGLDDETSGINLKNYTIEILKVEGISIDLDDLEIPYVYIHPNKCFEHILLSYGVKDLFIVIVTNTKEIIGYHILDLKEKYGIKDKNINHIR